MKRFSQRNSLVTLSDINITPLLDLAFVLLIIFVITTPLLEKGMELRLPEGGRDGLEVDRDSVRTVEIDRNGVYALDKQRVTIDQLEQQLVAAFRANRGMVLRIRGDRESMLKHFYPVIDRCTRNGITRINLATEGARSP
ncbi:MAG TPA: biopolymer transporter ExbD [Verrucomicrobiota bacterium]|nr:biopolymer transporter ExbD [Verrucomicrobiota bacterium]HNU52127.1 biopolymer transporter ExbD [Verrucomicrobiota bacterium]